MTLLDTLRRGELRLRFACRADQTVLAEHYFKPPLQVMRAIPDQAGCAYVYLLSPTGGVVQGDEYVIDVNVEAGAHALITTQAATKVYRMPDRPATQTVTINVGVNAVLEYVPDPTILFEDADFRQTITITLQPGAVLILHDIVMPGRLARGEVMRFRRYANRLTVRDAAGLLLYEPVNFEPLPGDEHRLGLLDGFACWGSWYLLGDLVRIGVSAEAFCSEQQAHWTDLTDAAGCLSPLHRNGIGARLISHYVSPISAAFERLRQCVRADFLQLPAAPLRK